MAQAGNINGDKRRGRTFILVTGASGYVGGRLVPRLLRKGCRVRVLTRNPGRLEGYPWLGQVEVAQGDALKPETLPPAIAGVDVVYYLIHSMHAGTDFPQRDLAAAQNVGHAAKAAGVQRIIYLGALGEPRAHLSEHLHSRQQIGEALREAGVPVTEFRAAVIVGPGSASFELIRYLTERMPIIVCPRWVFNQAQPIAIDDALDYLVAALDNPQSVNQIIEIGGSDVLTYGDMMMGYAHVRGLRRFILTVPLLTSRPFSSCVHWVAPVSANIARPLIEGLRNEVVVRDDNARRLFPHIQPKDYQTALRLALSQLHPNYIGTTRPYLLNHAQKSTVSVYLTTMEGMIIERRQRIVSAPALEVYRAFTTAKRRQGWWSFRWAPRPWCIVNRVASFLPGRQHPAQVRDGEGAVSWQVEALETGRLLLRSETKLPGQAWLEFEAKPLAEGKTRLIQTAFFAPKGLLGLAYWYLLYPVHRLAFSRLIQELARRAEGSD